MKCSRLHNPPYSTDTRFQRASATDDTKTAGFALVGCVFDFPVACAVFNNPTAVIALLVHNTTVRTLLLRGLEQSVDFRSVAAGSAADEDGRGFAVVVSNSTRKGGTVFGRLWGGKSKARKKAHHGRLSAQREGQGRSALVCARARRRCLPAPLLPRPSTSSRASAPVDIFTSF